MVECNWIDDKEFNRVAAEATAHMKGTEPERLMCIYTIHSFCNGCGDCADDLQGADLG